MTGLPVLNFIASRREVVESGGSKGAGRVEITGKTQRLIEKANARVGEAKGTVVFITPIDKYSLDMFRGYFRHGERNREVYVVASGNFV